MKRTIKILKQTIALKSQISKILWKSPVNVFKKKYALEPEIKKLIKWPKCGHDTDLSFIFLF